MIWREFPCNKGSSQCSSHRILELIIWSFQEPSPWHQLTHEFLRSVLVIRGKCLFLRSSASTCATSPTHFRLQVMRWPGCVDLPQFPTHRNYLVTHVLWWDSNPRLLGYESSTLSLEHSAAIRLANIFHLTRSLMFARSISMFVELFRWCVERFGLCHRHWQHRWHCCWETAGRSISKYLFFFLKLTNVATV